MYFVRYLLKTLLEKNEGINNQILMKLHNPLAFLEHTLGNYGDDETKEQ